MLEALLSLSSEHKMAPDCISSASGTQAEESALPVSEISYSVDVLRKTLRSVVTHSIHQPNKS